MSIESVLTSVYQGFINLFVNLIYLFLTPIVNLIWSAFPDTSIYLSYITQAFDLILKFVVYVIDLSMLYRPVIAFLIGSIIYRITYSQILSITKILVKWWHYLVP